MEIRKDIGPMTRINIGCGQTPTPGWHNYDNSLSVRLARYPMLVSILDSLGVLGDSQRSFVEFAMSSDIQWADATVRIPLPDNSADVLYTSHMVEHLDQAEVRRFLREARRVLMSGGIIRIAVPDLKKQVDEYVETGDANRFIERTHLAKQRPKSILDRLKYLIIGDRHHLWMYDASSIRSLLLEIGFEAPEVVDPGETTIPNPGNLNLYERSEESLYVEARIP